MQTSRRQHIQSIAIRKSAIMNNNQTTTTPSPILQQQHQLNDTLSPNVASNINPFDENLTKSIQEQLNPPILNRSSTAPQLPTSQEQQLIPLNSSINLKKSCTIGKYMLFDVLTTATAASPTTHNDLMYNIALNLVDKKSYYWKKIPACGYTKKLQPYFLMESSEHVYKFSELIVDNNDVYVFYQPHYGDLHSFMKEKKRLRESEAKSLFYQIVEVVRECHDNGIIVRDIKLKKFVFADAEKKKILLTNLEDCLVLDDENNDLIKSQQGCPAYVSPEVLNPAQTHYSGKLSDSWSLGIVLYTLLFGRYPFHHNVITTMFAKIAKGKFAIPTNGISLDAKILLRSLIRLNPNERLMSDEIVKTNWFKDFSFIDYKNVYEINKIFNNVKKHRSSLMSSQQSTNSNETVNYFADSLETLSSNNNFRNSIIVNFQEDQSVPN